MTDVLERPAATPAVAPGRQRGPGPRRRPPVGLRILAGLLGLTASVFTVALMLSDRAPAIVTRVFGERARGLWERIDASGRADFVTADRVPESDNIAHIAVWAVVMLLAGMTVWSWRWLVVTAPTIVGVSAMVEVGQGRWADTRHVEASDVVANGIGVIIGTVGVTSLYLGWSAAAKVLRPEAAR